jgi:hypothetical protein
VKLFRPLAARGRRGVAGRVLLLVLAVVALGLAIFAALLAHDVRSWRDTLRDDSVRYAISPSAVQPSGASTYLPSGISERVLGVAADRRRLATLRLFALANAADVRGGVTPRVGALLQTTEKALAEEAQDPSPARASQADTLLSIVLFKSARAAFITDVAAFSAAISAAQNAVRADPGNEHAKADLELLLRQFEADSKGGTQQQANNQGSRHRGKAVGRGRGVPPLNAATGDY